MTKKMSYNVFLDICIRVLFCGFVGMVYFLWFLCM